MSDTDAPTLHTAAMPPQGRVSSTVSSQASVAPNPLRRIAAALKKDDGDVVLTKIDDNLYRLAIHSETSNAAFRHVYDARGVFEERRSFAPSSTYTAQDVAEEEDSAAFYRQGEGAHQYYFNQSGLESAVTQLGTTDDMSTEEATALVNGLRADLEVGQSSTLTPENQEQDDEQANDSGNETGDNSDDEDNNPHQAKPEIKMPKKPTKEELEKQKYQGGEYTDGASYLRESLKNIRHQIKEIERVEKLKQEYVSKSKTAQDLQHQQAIQDEVTQTAAAQNETAQSEAAQDEVAQSEVAQDEVAEHVADQAPTPPAAEESDDGYAADHEDNDEHDVDQEHDDHDTDEHDENGGQQNRTREPRPPESARQKEEKAEDETTDDAMSGVAEESANEDEFNNDDYEVARLNAQMKKIGEELANQKAEQEEQKKEAAKLVVRAFIGA